ncbi:MAG: DNA-3-methyladenine glycosylase I [Chlamydiales bacterium]|jgi:DNA-3-methyladenine glycosylase I
MNSDKHHLLQRCEWASIDNTLYKQYHDSEWGVPLHDDRTLFEFLILEGAQAGLSWITILKRREEYRKAFDNFNVKKVASYNEKKVEELLQNAGIIRNKLKINSAIKNAQNFLKIQDEFGSFDQFLWNYVDGKVINNKRKSMKDLPPSTDISEKLSKDLKKRGFTFVGPTIIYAFMQATGMVNDHVVNCFRYNEISNM